MASSGHEASNPYAPSAPIIPEPYRREQESYPPPAQYGEPYAHGPYGSSYTHSMFPPGTPEEVVRSFQTMDRDRSGFIDEYELQQALSDAYRRFSIGTIRLLMFLFKNPNSSAKIGLLEFSALWSCLGQWREIFDRHDKNRSGKIDSSELRDALYSLGYAVPPSVLQLLVSKYVDGSGRNVELPFDNFVECGMIVKGLTDKFKERDPYYTGSATLSYDAFMQIILPFLVS